MRLEVVVPDDSVEAHILSGLDNPERYVLDLVRADGGRGVTTFATGPDYLAIMRQADSSPNRFQSREEVDAYLRALRDEW